MAFSAKAAKSHPVAVEVLVVMPCLNEADTLGNRIQKAQRAMADSGIAGEIIVNGSTDGSVSIATGMGHAWSTLTQRVTAMPSWEALLPLRESSSSWGMLTTAMTFSRFPSL